MAKNDLEKFINPNGNDMFSYLKGLDLQDLLLCIENFYLTYRASLGLPEFVTFGTEIEYEGVFQFLLDAYTGTCFKDWNSRYDGSLGIIGGETVSPIMHDDKKSWDELKRVCHFLKGWNANTYEKAGGHVHVGAHILGKDLEAWITFLKLYTCYENVLFRFGFGDKATPRKGMEEYAYVMASTFMYLLHDVEDGKTDKNSLLLFLNKLGNYDRYSGINFQNLIPEYIDESRLRNTVEYRFPNATVEEVVWQNNINAFAKMMLACRNHQIDTEFLEYRLKHGDIADFATLEYYRELNLKSALEFVDLAFDRNIDKVYFLRQYLKGFYNVVDTDKTVKAKRFIK